MSACCCAKKFAYRLRTSKGAEGGEAAGLHLGGRVVATAEAGGCRRVCYVHGASAGVGRSADRVVLRAVAGVGVGVWDRDMGRGRGRGSG